MDDRQERETYDITSLNKAVFSANEISRANDFCATDKQDDEIGEKKQKKKERRLVFFGIVCLACFLFGMFFCSPATPDTTPAAKEAAQTGKSTVLKIGTVLFSKEESLQAQDLTITHTIPEDETIISVWDYAAEDGDYVQIFVDEKPVTEAFMIKHAPREVAVPTVGSVKIKGVRDGGGGITYAVHYKLNNTTYFNSLSKVNDLNSYTLRREN